MKKRGRALEIKTDILCHIDHVKISKHSRLRSGCFCLNLIENDLRVRYNLKKARVAEWQTRSAQDAVRLVLVWVRLPPRVLKNPL